MITHCNFQARITQPILQLFFYIFVVVLLDSFAILLVENYMVHTIVLLLPIRELSQT